MKIKNLKFFFIIPSIYFLLRLIYGFIGKGFFESEKVIHFTQLFFQLPLNDQEFQKVNFGAQAIIFTVIIISFMIYTIFKLFIEKKLTTQIQAINNFSYKISCLVVYATVTIIFWIISSIIPELIDIPLSSNFIFTNLLLSFIFLDLSVNLIKNSIKIIKH